MSAKREILSAVVSTGLGLQSGMGSPAPQGQPLFEPADYRAKEIQQLGVMLEELGYAVEKQLNERGETIAFLVTVEFEGQRYTFSICRDEDNLNYFLTAKVRSLSEGAEIPPLPLMNLLQVNAKIRPAYVSFDEASRQIVLRLTNINFTRSPEKLRLQVREFCNFLRMATDVLGNSASTNSPNTW